MGDVRVDGLPVHLSRTDWSIARGAPCLGEHNEEVLGELLGLCAATRSTTLRAEGVDLMRDRSTGCACSSSRTSARAFAGKLLADMGADVVLVEPPGGSAQRRYAPVRGRRPDPERSLSWWHYNTSKRGITLDLDDAARARASRAS